MSFAAMGRVYRAVGWPSTRAGITRLNVRAFSEGGRSHARLTLPRASSRATWFVLASRVMMLRVYSTSGEFF